MARRPAQSAPFPPSRLVRDPSNATLTLSYTGGVATQSAVGSTADLDELFTTAMDMRSDKTPRSVPSGHSQSDPSFNFAAAFPGSLSLSSSHNYELLGDSHYGSQHPSSEARQSIDLSGEHSRASHHPDPDLPWNPLQATEVPNKALSSGIRQFNSAHPPRTPKRNVHPFHDFSGPSSFHDSALGTLTGPSHDENQSLLSSPLTEMDHPFPYGLSIPSEPQDVCTVEDEEQPEPQAPTQVDQPRRAPRSQRQQRNKEELTCDDCGHKSKTPSDAKKHQARHDAPYKCNFSDCARSQRGFATINDLHRHEKSVHKTNKRGSRYYKCFAPNCQKAEKQWPRLDNFKQHLVRMHEDLEVDDLVQQSNEWYESQFEEDDSVQSGAAAGEVRRQEENVRRESQQKKRCRESPPESPDHHQKRPALDPMLTQMAGPSQDSSRLSPLSARLPSTAVPSSFGQQTNQPGSQNRMLNVRFNTTPQMQRFPSQPQMQRLARPVGLQNPYQRQRAETQAGPQMQPSSQQQFSFQLNNPSSFNPPQQGQMTQSAYDQLSQNQDTLSRDLLQHRAATAPDRNPDYNQIRIALLDDTHPIPPGQSDLDIDMSSYLAWSGAGTVFPHSSPSTTNGPHTPIQAPKISESAARVHSEGDEEKVKALTDRFVDELRTFLSECRAERKDRPGFLSPEELPSILEAMAAKSSRASASEGGVTGKQSVGINPVRPEKPHYICKTCHKHYPRRSELRKHEKRHSRPYGCVIDDCYKKFGSKNDLKRHEIKTHPEQKECYRCDGSHLGEEGKPCYKVFYSGRDRYKDHLLSHVTKDPHRAEVIADERRIPAGSQGRFWCGFCNKIVSHDKIGQEAFDHRLTHIDHHFSKGLKAVSWIALRGNGLSKAEMDYQQKTEKNLRLGGRGMEIVQQSEESESQATSTSSSPNSHDDHEHSHSSKSSELDVHQRQQSQKMQKQHSNNPPYSQQTASTQQYSQRNQQQMMQQMQQMQRVRSQGQQFQQMTDWQDEPRGPTYNGSGQRIAKLGGCCLCELEYLLELGKRCPDCNHQLCPECKKIS